MSSYKCEITQFDLPYCYSLIMQLPPPMYMQKHEMSRGGTQRKAAIHLISLHCDKCGSFGMPTRADLAWFWQIQRLEDFLIWSSILARWCLLHHLPIEDLIHIMASTSPGRCIQRILRYKLANNERIIFQNHSKLYELGQPSFETFLKNVSRLYKSNIH